MSPKASAIPVADICLYARCPRSYWLGRVEEVPASVSPHSAQRDALASIILSTLRGEVESLDEAQGKFEMKFTERFLAVDHRIRTKPAGLLMDGQRWINHFWTLERPGIKAQHAGALCEAKFNWPLNKRVRIKAEVEIVDRNYLGFIRCAGHRVPVRQFWSSSILALTSLVANIANIYVLLFIRGSGDIIRRRWCWNTKARNQVKHLADEAIKGIKRKIWTRCDSEAPWCSKSGCKYFFACMERYAEDEVEQT